MSNSTTNSVAVLTEEARIFAASKLKEIVEACVTEACGTKVSLAHAKFVLDIAQLTAVEKQSKQTSEKSDAEAETGDPQEKCLTEVLLEKLNSARVDPVK